MTISIDLSNFRDITEGDVELEAELFNDFISSFEALLSELEKADGSVLREGVSYKKSAHSLKGLAANLGAFKLAQYCEDAQDASTEEAKAGLLKSMREEFAAIKVYLLSEMDSLTAG